MANVRFIRWCLLTATGALCLSNSIDPAIKAFCETRIAVRSAPRSQRIGLSGRDALAHVEKLVSFGPRTPGSPGIAKAQSYISEFLRGLRLNVEHQDFLADTPNGPVNMKNIVAKKPGEGSEILILASHYDTLVARTFSFVGANDGGSSSGLLLELARVLSSQKRIGANLWFVFFDGEEAQRQWSETDSLYGSRYFVDQLRTENLSRHVRAVILMDMIGDRDLRLENDLSSTPELMRLVRASARELGHGKYLADGSKGIVDDHIPFIRAGIPAVDLIDLDYGFNNSFWHSPNDTLDKISSLSLNVSGEIVLRVVENLSKKSSN